MIGYALKDFIGRIQPFVFEKMLSDYGSMEKVDENGRRSWATSVDTEAQKMIAKWMREGFEGYGIIGEEEELRVPCTHPGHSLFFTVDPVDGTHAFMRKQAYGISTMISLIVDGEVVSAYVGDVSTGDIYGYRPGSVPHRIRRVGNGCQVESLSPYSIEERPLGEIYALLRDPPEMYKLGNDAIYRILKRVKSYHITGGSIGMHMVRLWTNENALTILQPGKQNMWDLAPVYGISKKLGYCFLLLGDDNTLVEFEPHFLESLPSFSISQNLVITPECYVEDLSRILKT